MIGMSQIKKKTIQGIIIGASIGVVGIGLTLWWAISTIKTYENGTNKKFLANFTKQVPVLTRPVTQGEVITDDIVTTANIHVNTVPDNVADSSDVVNKVAKYNISANIPLTQSMVTDEIISADIRSQEVNTVVMPSDLDELDYVDVRIMYPNGTDYIVLAQKQVEKIAGQTMWLNLAEDERLLLNSAIVDSFLHQGTKLYATKYADSESQIKVESAIDETMLEKEESEEGTEGEEGTTEESTNTSNATATEEDYSNFSVP